MPFAHHVFFWSEDGENAENPALFETILAFLALLPHNRFQPQGNPDLQLLDIDGAAAVRVEELEGVSDLPLLLLGLLRLGARLLPRSRGSQRRLLKAGGLGTGQRG